VCAAWLSLNAFGQTLSVGVIGGGSPTFAFRDQFLPVPAVPGSPVVGISYFSPSKDYVVGGTLELHFNPHWSLEADGLFRELHLTWAAVLANGSLNSVSPSPVVTWEFPLLAKYRLPGRMASPFLEAGPSFRTAGNLNGTNPSHAGIAGGLGVEMHWRGINIAPTARYIRWAPDGYGGSDAHTASNQVELLMGLSHEAESHWRPGGDRISLGVMLGTNLTGDLRTATLGPIETGNASFSVITSSGHRQLIIGPTFELRLPFGLSVESDALHRSISQEEIVSVDGTRTNGGTTSFPTWEFPVLAKYGFHIRGVKPFVGLGPSFRRLQSLTGSSPYGIVTGAGVTFQMRHVTVTPSIRYTHWAPNQPWDFGGPLQNQTAFLAGFAF
jgi:hypothetical protein